MAGDRAGRADAAPRHRPHAQRRDPPGHAAGLPPAARSALVGAADRPRESHPLLGRLAGAPADSGGARRSRQPRPAEPGGARRAGRRRTRRRAPGDPDAVPLPAVGQPRDPGRRQVCPRLRPAGQRPRPVQPVGRVRRGAVDPLRRANDALRGGQRAESPAAPAGRGGGARRGDAHDRRRRRPPTRPRRHLPSALLQRRARGRERALHAAGRLRRSAPARARRRRVRGRRPLDLVAARLQRDRVGRRRDRRAARAARRALARGASARRRAAPLRDGGRRAARLRGAAARRKPAARRGAGGAGAAHLRRARACRAHPGLGLHTQYTVQADPNYDCGLRETGGAARPAFAAYVA